MFKAIFVRPWTDERRKCHFLPKLDEKSNENVFFSSYFSSIFEKIVDIEHNFVAICSNAGFWDCLRSITLKVQKNANTKSNKMNV